MHTADRNIRVLWWICFLLTLGPSFSNSPFHFIIALLIPMSTWFKTWGQSRFLYSHISHHAHQSFRRIGGLVSFGNDFLCITCAFFQFCNVGPWSFFHFCNTYDYHICKLNLWNVIKGGWMVVTCFYFPGAFFWVYLLQKVVDCEKIVLIL